MAGSGVTKSGCPIPKLITSERPKARSNDSLIADFGVLAILLCYKLGTSLFGPTEGLIAAFLLSISTLHLRNSREAVQYSQFLFFSLLSIFLFYRAIKEGDAKWWIGFAISTLLGLYTHFYTVFILLIEMPFFIYYLHKNENKIVHQQKYHHAACYIFHILSYKYLLIEPLFLA